MTTPPNDPFAQHPPQVAAPGYPQASAPGSPPPPPLPGQAPPPGAFAPTGWAAEKPQGLAITAIVLTGLYAASSLYSSFVAQSTIDETKATLGSGNTATDLGTTAFGALGTIVMLASFVVLALWMSRIRRNLASRGVKAGGPPAVEWWGWFVPLANFVLPLLGMKAISRKKASMGLLLGWWLPWCIMWLATFAAGATSFFAVDLSTGDLVRPEALDASVPLTHIATVAVIVSWAFLAVIIRRVTDRHLDD